MCLYGLRITMRSFCLFGCLFVCLFVCFFRVFMFFPHIFRLFLLRQYLRGCAMLYIQVFIDMMLLLDAVVIF